MEVTSSWLCDGATELSAELVTCSEHKIVFPPLTLAPSATSKRLDVKCQIDIRFKQVALVSLAVVSNARNVELYVARPEATFEYACTTRGKKGEAERYTVRVDDKFDGASAVRLRMLSLRENPAALVLESLVLECKPSDGVEAIFRPPVKKADDLQFEHLATIGTEMLFAAERRVCRHIDAVCDKMTARFDVALAAQDQRLARIEDLLRTAKS